MRSSGEQADMKIVDSENIIQWQRFIIVECEFLFGPDGASVYSHQSEGTET